MRRFKAVLVIGFLGMMLIGVPSDGTSADRSRWGCRRGERLHIQDLDMLPDPVIEGQRIRGFRVRIRFDGNRECETEIIVREGGEIVGHQRDYRLRPGINEIDIRAAEGYRFRGREHCFAVLADLEGSRREVDAARRFCAYQRAAWSMREPGDRGRFDR